MNNNNTLEQIKKLTKSTHATTCTKNTCDCGVFGIELDLNKLFMALLQSEHQTLLKEIEEKVIGLQTHERLESHNFFDDNPSNADRIITVDKKSVLEALVSLTSREDRKGEKA